MSLQRTDAWYIERLGKVTASRVADALARTSTGWGASRTNYMAELIAERLTGTRAEAYTNAAMEWGVRYEDEAVAAYEFYRDTETTECGFIVHPRIPQAGASPDRLVGQSGLLEIKCPKTATHIETLIARRIPLKYQKQILWQMACTGAQWCDFASYDPRMPEHLKLFVVRLKRDNKTIAILENEVIDFLAELQAKVDALTTLENTAWHGRPTKEGAHETAPSNDDIPF